MFEVLEESGAARAQRVETGAGGGMGAALRPLDHVEVCADCRGSIYVYTPRRLLVCAWCLWVRFARERSVRVVG